MKKIRYILSISLGGCLALLMLASCARKELEEPAFPAGRPLLSFRAEIAPDFVSESVKSAVTLSTGASSFADGDEVKVTDGTHTAIYRYSSSSGLFTKSAGDDIPGANVNTAAVFFPAGLAASPEDGGKYFNVTLPSTQAYDTESLSNPPMAGYFREGWETCRFYNLCTILKISAVIGYAVTDKTLSGFSFTSHQASIAGAGVYQNGALTMASGGEKILTVSGTPATTIGAAGSPTQWYLMLPSQTYPGGFELTMSFTDGKTYTYATDKDITLAPGYISAMEAFTCQYFSGGSGTEGNPYRIANMDDLMELKNRISYSVVGTNQFGNKYYVQTADVVGNGGSNWRNILSADEDHAFTGTYDGQGHRIYNTTFDPAAGSASFGVFGVLSGATVKNLTIEKIRFAKGYKNDGSNGPRTADYTAYLAGRALDGTLIENCHIKGANDYNTLYSTHTAVGAIVGELSASTVRDCSVTGISLQGAGGRSDGYGIGGVVGVITGTSPSSILGCSFSGGTVTAVANTVESSPTADHSGGIVGSVFKGSVGTRIEDCTFSGTLTSSGGSCAGIVGDMSGHTQVKGCTVASGTTITSGGGNNVAGIVGYVQPKQESNSVGEISRCTFKGRVTGSGDRTAGIAGNEEVVPIFDCLVEDATVTGVNQVAGAVGQVRQQSVRNVKVKNTTVIGSGKYVAGVVALLAIPASGRTSCPEVCDCSVEASSVTGTYPATSDNDPVCVGGVVGAVESTTSEFYGRILRSHSTGSVTAAGTRVGGIVGSLASPALVNECWSTADVSATGSYGGHTGGIAGAIATGVDDVLIINSTYYGGTVSATGNTAGAVGGIVGSMAYAYALGDIQRDYVVNCFAHPVKVLCPNATGAGGVTGYVCRQILDNCYSPVADADVTTKSGNQRSSIMGVQRRGGRTINCYGTFGPGRGWHDPMGAAESTFQTTTITVAEMGGDSKALKVYKSLDQTSCETVTGLTAALNMGAKLYNGTLSSTVPHHGTLPYGVRANAWAKGSYGYPTLVGSPICDAPGDQYSRTLTLSNPNLTVFLPPRSEANGKLVIVVPGGGYHYLSRVESTEGEGWASWYNDRGYACAVLRYRLPGGNCTLPVEDLENAVTWFRDHSEELRINAVGVHGFSTGGHLASTIATHTTGKARPDFQILFYPVITMGTGTHTESRNNFLGTSPTEEMITYYSNQLQVTSSTPRAFVMYYTGDDSVNAPANGAAYVSALTAAGVPVTSKLFTGNTHGWNDTDTVDDKTVREHLSDWLGTLPR